MLLTCALVQVSIEADASSRPALFTTPPPNPRHHPHLVSPPSFSPSHVLLCVCVSLSIKPFAQQAYSVQTAGTTTISGETRQLAPFSSRAGGPVSVSPLGVTSYEVASCCLAPLLRRGSGASRSKRVSLWLSAAAGSKGLLQALITSVIYRRNVLKTWLVWLVDANSLLFPGSLRSKLSSM